MALHKLSLPVSKADGDVGRNDQSRSSQGGRFGRADLADLVSDKQLTPTRYSEFRTTRCTRMGEVQRSTSGMKRDVARKFYTETARELAIPGRPARLLSALGLRAAESRARARRPTVAVDTAASSGRREVTSWLPIRDFSTEEVWRTIKASGAPWHPAYRSVSRLSCRLCPLASRRDLTISARMNPELAAEYAEVEDEIGHRFRNDLSMKQIISEASELSGARSLLSEEPRGCGAGAAPWPGTGCAA